MNLNSKLFKRIATATVGVIFILGILIYGGSTGVALFALAASAAALYEYFILLCGEQELWFQRVLGSILGFFLAAIIIFRASFLYEGICISFLILFCVYLYVVHRERGTIEKQFSLLSYSFLGIFYVSFLFSFWPKVRLLEEGVYWIFLVFIIPWISDTTAYVVGKQWGQAKLSPVISPHKTQEGSIAAIVASIFAVILYKIFIFDSISYGGCIYLGGVGSIFGQVGDLFESFIKRAFSVKDSGVAIPGHGGILDRFDSVLFCGPFIYFSSFFL
ncbi:MAG: phosphatidate cytidylyltransferase [Deltaproteobacteria bacterium]|nr:phosphatidate cytidylyltransferase [Deltaproteobacteria bacterium]